ncbi:hypothetical protein, partial [Sphingobium sp.]|uniref:hypothetical protein n=1 Tax=Sphingobium sp. TaxID=1912891 RepID=UPI002E1F5F2B
VEERPALFTAPIELEREEVGLLGRIIQKLSGGKLADQTIIDAKIAAGLLTPAEIAKRDVSDKERAALAEQGHAMNDGSYPIASVQDLQNAVQAFGRAKNKAAVKRHIIRRAKALKATDRLPADWSGSTKDGEMAGGGEKLAKAASLYTVSSMIELLGRLEYLEECCEGPAGFCCAVVGGGDGTVVECDKAFTDRFGALLVQFADMTAELLDMAVSQMKKEEADEAAAKLATALHRRRQKVAAKAARADDRAIRKAAKLICRTGMDLQKNWSDAAHQAATDARAKASDHRKAAVEHFGQQAAAEGRGATDEAQNHLMAGATHMEAARGFDRAASAIESDTNGAVSARAQHLSGKLAQKLAFAETSDMRQRILGKAAGKPTTLAIEELAGTRDDDGATGDVMSDLAMIAKTAQAG